MPGLRKMLTKQIELDVADSIIDTKPKGRGAVRFEIPTLNYIAVANMSAEDLDRRMGARRLYRSRCPIVTAGLGKISNLACLLDSGAEINVIREREAGIASLAVSPLPRELRGEGMTVANGKTQAFSGIIHAAEFNIGGICIRTPLLVSAHLSVLCILGEPWSCRASLSTKRTPSSRVIMAIRSEDGRESIKIQAC